MMLHDEQWKKKELFVLHGSVHMCVCVFGSASPTPRFMFVTRVCQLVCLSFCLRSSI